MSPQEMCDELEPAFRRMKDSGARIVHYKICSTFDSSPQVGSIGRALELGRTVFGETTVPIVVAAPNLGRYQVFGNLFARSGLDSPPFRLDRHPTMSRHPITPMSESDLCRHLAAQTDSTIGLVDVLRLNDCANTIGDEDMQQAALLFDVLEPKHLARIGQAIETLAARSSPKFVIGSSGVEYALAEYWATSGSLASLQSHPASRPGFPSVSQLFAITGSCSPVNDRQIAWAVNHGFQEIAIDSAKLVHPSEAAREIESIAAMAVPRLQAGASLILHSSRGPNDPRVEATRQALRDEGLNDDMIKLHSSRVLGPRLGQIARRILSEYPLPRVGIAGGDTSGFIARELELVALEAIAPVAPGSPLCRAHADNRFNGVEFFFKGGQVGKDDVWNTIRGGTM